MPLAVRESSGSGFTIGTRPGVVLGRAGGRRDPYLGGRRARRPGHRVVPFGAPSFSSAPAMRKCRWASSHAPRRCATSPSVRCALRCAGANPRTFSSGSRASRSRPDLKRMRPRLNSSGTDSACSVRRSRVIVSASSNWPRWKSVIERLRRTSGSRGRSRRASSNSRRAVSWYPRAISSLPRFRWRRKSPWSKNGAGLKGPRRLGSPRGRHPAPVRLSARARAPAPGVP